MLDTTPRPRGIVPIAESAAMRDPVRHKYGPAIGKLVDPFRRRKVKYESDLERNWLTVLIASPDVRDVREQQRLMIPNDRGRPTEHVFDILVEHTDGVVKALACKYKVDVTPELVALLQHAADTVGDAFADFYEIRSEAGLTRTMIWNARQVITCALDFDFGAQEAIRNALPTLGARVSLAECDAIVGDGERGSKAAIALIQAGLFDVPPGERIGSITELRNLFTN